MIVIEFQIRLYNSEKNLTKEERRPLLMWARMGLECSDNGDMILWKCGVGHSFFVLYFVCLLGLVSRGNVIEICSVDDLGIHEASELLVDIDKKWTGIETQRKVLLRIAS